MEPSPKTSQTIGELCGAWAYLEAQTEMTLWGVLKLNADLAEAFVWRMPLQQRWAEIERAGRKHVPKTDQESLKKINKAIAIVARDRNIVIHGLVHAKTLPNHNIKIGEDVKNPVFTQHPCWSIFIGEEAGKNFPISTDAVLLIKENIGKIIAAVSQFNKKMGYTTGTKQGDVVEGVWPKPLIL